MMEKKPVMNYPPPPPPEKPADRKSAAERMVRFYLSELSMNEALMALAGHAIARGVCEANQRWVQIGNEIAGLAWKEK